MEDPDDGRALATPGEHDLDDRQDRERHGHHHAPPPEPRAEREQEERDCPDEEDGIPEAVVEVEAVAELVLRQRSRIRSEPTSTPADISQRLAA